MKTLILLCTLMCAGPLAAQTFQVALGGKVLGTLTYAEQGRDATLLTTLDSTPLGVFNGTFRGTSSTAGRFTGESKSSRKQRVVTVDTAKGRATAVKIVPENEATELSDIARVPEGITDPVRLIGSFIDAAGCPAATQMYDGRRVVVLRPEAGTQAENTLICPFSYKVVAGPGHLSPLGISSAKLELVYEISSDTQTLREINVSSGIFGLTLVRTR